MLKVGKIGAARKSSDFFSLRVMNEILGGQFTSRINMNLREDKGYSRRAIVILDTQGRVRYSQVIDRGAPDVEQLRQIVRNTRT